MARSQNTGCGGLVVFIVLVAGAYNYLQKLASPAPAATSPVAAAPQPAPTPKPAAKAADLSLANLIVADTSDLKGYADRYGAWDYDPENGTESTNGKDGDNRHHIDGVGDVALTYLKGQPHAWQYTIDPFKSVIDKIAPDDDANMEHLETTDVYDLYRIKTGPLKGDFIRTSGYLQGNDKRVDVYTPQMQKVKMPEEYAKYH